MSKQETPPKRRLEKSKVPLLITVSSVVVLLLLAFTLSYYGQDFLPTNLNETVSSDDQQQNINDQTVTSTQNGNNTHQLLTDTTETKKNSALQTKREIPQASQKAENISTDLKTHTRIEEEKRETLPFEKAEKPAEATVMAPPGKSSAFENDSAAIVKNFYTTLDNRAYLKTLMPPDATSEEYFTKLIQRMIDNPPVVSREMDDLYTLLKNTAHFFRIIGKDNIILLKGILDREKDQFEEVLLHFYKLTLIDNATEHHFGLRMTKEEVYEYAVFFLNTMGGRMYLFRRDSVSRLAVSFYSILAVEQANREARNHYGLDITPSIKLLIPEIENSGSHLKLRDYYLEQLYLIENRLP